MRPQLSLDQGGRLNLRRHVLVLLAVLSAVFAPMATASSIVSTSNETFVSLGVNSQGQAMVVYKDNNGKVHNVVAYGAVNAIPPKKGAMQLNFKYDYSGGYTLFRGNISSAAAKLRSDQALFQQAKTAAEAEGKKYTPDVLKYSALVNADYSTIQKLHSQSNSFSSNGGFGCRKYTGPKLAFMVAACTASDGSYWAVQQWQRQLPDYGIPPTPQQAAFELHLSHWTGPLPVLSVETDWSYHKWQHLFGTFTYAGNAVYGFKSTSVGAPLDTFGRNVYLDSYGSDYGGTGWKRVNSFLTHDPTGAFCYGISPHGSSNLTGEGSEYRLTIMGPGVTPDISVQVPSPGPYNAALDATQNQKIAALHDSLCKPN